MDRQVMEGTTDVSAIGGTHGAENEPRRCGGSPTLEDSSRLECYEPAEAVPV
jgi:hypothetical protein